MIKLKSHTTEADHGQKNILDEIQKLKVKPYVKVGVLENAGQHDSQDHADTTVALIASVHEFGSESRGIPERSFIRSTMNEKEGFLNELTNGMVDELYRGNTTVEKMIGVLGLQIQRLIKLKIQSNIAPALKDSTVKKKGSEKGKSTALINTSQLIKSIQYEVVMDGKISGDDEDISV